LEKRIGKWEKLVANYLTDQTIPIISENRFPLFRIML